MAATSKYLILDNWPSKEEIDEKVEEKGTEYTTHVWKLLQCQDKLVLTPEIAERYKIVQKHHIRLTGHSLPDTIKGAIKTRAQVRNEIDSVDEVAVEKAVQGGLAAKLAKMRGNK